MERYSYAVKFVMKIYNRRKKIPVSRFFKLIETRLGTKLSRESKEEIIEMLHEEGRVIKSKYGKVYILAESVKEQF
jgi:hypothetical protein